MSNKLSIEIEGISKARIRRIISDDEVNLPILANGVEVGKITQWQQHHPKEWVDGKEIPSWYEYHAYLEIMGETRQLTDPSRILSEAESLGEIDEYVKSIILKPDNTKYQMMVSEYVKNLVSYNDEKDMNRNPEKAYKIADERRLDVLARHVVATHTNEINTEFKSEIKFDFKELDIINASINDIDTYYHKRFTAARNAIQTYEKLNPKIMSGEKLINLIKWGDISVSSEKNKGKTKKQTKANDSGGMEM